MKTSSPPSSWRRLMAFFLDGMVAQIFLSPVFFWVMQREVSSLSLVLKSSLFWACLFLLLSFEVWCLYFWSCTIGKFMFGLRLVNSAGNDLSLISCFIRALGDLISLLLNPILKVTLWLRFDRRHLLDLISETQVVEIDAPQTQKHRRVLLVIVLFYFCSMTLIEALLEVPLK